MDSFSPAKPPSGVQGKAVYTPRFMSVFGWSSHRKTLFLLVFARFPVINAVICRQLHTFLQHVDNVFPRSFP